MASQQTRSGMSKREKQMLSSARTARFIFEFERHLKNPKKHRMPRVGGKAKKSSNGGSNLSYYRY